ncbi:MAG: ABC transporter permease [Hyphomicrobiaceae bacterium]
MTDTSADGTRQDLPGGYLVWQLGLGVVLLGVWEWAGFVTGSQWVNRPSSIGYQLAQWSTGEIYPHLATTIIELLSGLVIGTILGVLAGLLLGRATRLGPILRPIIVAFYSIPLVSLAPLFIMFFGVEMLPKIVLVSIVVFFLLFFNTFSGVATIDDDLVATLQLMGASRREVFMKVVLPASTAWVLAGIKVALPFALVGTITGEMLAARSGLGYLLNQASQQFDMTAIYAVLAILMVVGVIVSEVAVRLEGWLLRWRNTNT